VENRCLEFGKHMSKIGKIPVSIKEGVTAVNENGKVVVKGPKGELSFPIPVGIEVAIVDDLITVTLKKGMQENRALFGLTRSMIFNMVKGVSDGFTKKLELVGVGYRSQVMGKDLSISVGFSHPVKIVAPDGITFGVSENAITVTGMDKGLVGNTAAVIRAIKPPEPYKGKGIKYTGEHIRRKAGKAAKAVGGK